MADKIRAYLSSPFSAEQTLTSILPSAYEARIKKLDGQIASINAEKATLEPAIPKLQLIHKDAIIASVSTDAESRALLDTLSDEDKVR